jgi:TonB family protein
MAKDEFLSAIRQGEGGMPASQLEALVRQSCVAFALTPEEEQDLRKRGLHDIPDVLRDHSCITPEFVRNTPATIRSVLYDLSNRLGNDCIKQHLKDRGGRSFELVPDTAKAIKDAGGTLDLIGFIAFVPLVSVVPPTISFAATPEDVETGRTATLRWSVRDAADATIDHGLGQVPNEGQREVSPGTYTLTARGPGGSVSKAVTVREKASEPEPQIRFTADPATAECGQPATLKWSVGNATEVAIDPDLGAVPSEGQRQVSPRSSTTYRLQARGPGGSGSGTIRVEVKGEATGGALDANGRLHVLEPDQMQRVRERAKPIFPPDAARNNVQGVVVVEVTIDKNGRPKAARSLQGPSLLRLAAEQAARQWRWQPAMFCGEPVEVVTSVTFGFKM